MALSNWDTLAVNEKGEHCNGEYTSPLGVSVVFYKNWLYVRDERAWREGGKFGKSTVAEIHLGTIDYQDISIIAVRGPKNGVYACIYNGYGKDATGIVGCGIYGYEGDEFVGVGEREKHFFSEFLSDENYMIPESFRKLDLSGSKRFNQGDAFFQKQGIMIGSIETESGKADKPILQKLLE